MNQMDSIDLYDIKRRIYDWRSHSPKTLFSMLDSLVTSQLTNNIIIQSKIFVSVKSLSEVNIQEELHKPTIYDWKEYIPIVEKAKKVYQQLITQLKKKMEMERTKIPAKKNQEKIKLFEGFSETFSGYVSRLPYLNAIGQALYNNDNKKPLEKIKNVVIGLEKEIYQKNYYKESKKMNYEQDIKTLIQFLKRDKTGGVTERLFSGAFTFKSAAQLISDDWIDVDTRKEQIKIQQEQLEMDQIGFYEDLQKREMEDVEGSLCKGCGEKRVYLVGEQQTRASDEPTTKFFRCFNCGDKFRT